MDSLSALIASQSNNALTYISLLLHYYYYPIFAVLFALLLYFRRQRTKTLLAAFLLALLLSLALKAYFQEPRECVQAYLKTECPSDYAFPSGHAALSFLLVASALGTRFFAPYLALAAIVSLSRVYLGIHSIVDISGGAVIGIASFFIAETILKKVKNWLKD